MVSGWTRPEGCWSQDQRSPGWTWDLRPYGNSEVGDWEGKSRVGHKDMVSIPVGLLVCGIRLPGGHHRDQGTWTSRELSRGSEQ